MPPLKPRIRSIDDLLGVTETSSSKNESKASNQSVCDASNEIQMLPPQIIRSFRGSPFREYGGERFDDLVDSVSQHGVLVPAFVRKIEPDENGFEYEMLAGRHRQRAAIIANRELPCIVKENLSDEDAWIYVIETSGTGSALFQDGLSGTPERYY